MAKRLRGRSESPVTKDIAPSGIDEMMTEMGITPAIPSKENEDRSARVVDFDKEKYRQRNIVERLVGWLKECRRVFSRYEKTAINFRGIANIAIIQRYLKIATP
jgi:transposase